MYNIEMNKYQTPITEELMNTLPEEVQNELLECINTVPLIQNLISPNRKYAKDLERDEYGRIIVDICNPHILENMDYFRPTALHIQKYGTITNLRPNANPNSPYGKWIREERRRIWDGYVRESDGEWVTGFLYWYLNYSPIMLNKIKNGTKIANRVQDMPETWEGIYLRFHYIEQARNGGLYDQSGGKHGAELASRGKSKSYSMASILSHNFVMGVNEEAHENTLSLVTAYSKEYLIKDGVLNKFLTISDFCALNTQFPRKRLKASLQEMVWMMGYLNLDTGVESGTKNQVMGVSSKDDESKLRGKRAAFIGIEEFGTFPRLIDLYNVLIPSVQEGDIVFGFMYLQGTAGDNESDFAGAQEIMYNPRGYDMYALKNVYDKRGQGKQEFVFFFPGYLNRKGCYNQDGVSDVIAALIEILMNRYRVKYNSTDPNTILKTKAEIPITPSEAIVKTGVNMFPIVDLQTRLAEIDNNPHEYDNVFVGEFIIKNGEVDFKPTSDQPIRDFPTKDNKLKGAVELFELPKRNSSGKVFSDRYILSCDPYDDDSSNTMSFGSIHIYDMWTEQYVGHYTGRPDYADEFYEIARRACLFFNGRMNYENNKKGLFSHFSKHNSLYLLTDVLEFLKDKDMIKKEGYGNKAKGTNASKPINTYGLGRFRNWLISPITITKEIDGEMQEVTVPRLSTLRERALIKELILFNDSGNFDRISSNIMLMLLRENYLIYHQNITQEDRERADLNYLGNDPFFNKHYK